MFLLYQPVSRYPFVNACCYCSSSIEIVKWHPHCNKSPCIPILKLEIGSCFIEPTCFFLLEEKTLVDLSTGLTSGLPFPRDTCVFNTFCPIFKIFETLSLNYNITFTCKSSASITWFSFFNAKLEVTHIYTIKIMGICYKINFV